MKEKFSDQDLRDLIDNEGLGYAVYGYLSADRVEDPYTALLWSNAYVALAALDKHLNEGSDYE